MGRVVIVDLSALSSIILGIGIGIGFGFGIGIIIQ